MAPEAPGVFTTEMRWPKTFSISLARILTVRSVAPPAGHGTMAVIGLVGFHSPAATGKARANTPRHTSVATAQRRAFIALPPVKCRTTPELLFGPLSSRG